MYLSGKDIACMPVNGVVNLVLLHLLVDDIYSN